MLQAALYPLLWEACVVLFRSHVFPSTQRQKPTFADVRNQTPFTVLVHVPGLIISGLTTTTTNGFVITTEQKSLVTRVTDIMSTVSC